MKKLTLLIVALAFANLAYSQMWKAKVPNKVDSEEKLNFYEIQKEFNAHWDAFNVKKGKYVVDGKEQKVPGWKQYKRWEWFWETRIDRETGEFPNVNLLKIQEEYLKNKNTKEDLSNWQSMGPDSSYGGYAGIGRINCITFHPTDKDVFWIGAPSGGLWKTTDGGLTWICLTDGLPVIGVSDIVLANDYETSKTIYISTGDRDAKDNYSIGILKSTDDGVSWNTTGLSFNLVNSGNAIISKFMKNPNNSNILYAGYNGKIRKSTDAGNTWNIIVEGYIYDMDLKPNCEDTVIYAVRYNYDNQKREFIKSSDGGSNWSTTHTFNGDVSRVDLALSKADSTVVYALASNGNGGLEGVYKSTNSGLSLTKVFDGMVSGNNLMGYYSDGSGDDSGQGWYDIVIVASPTDENTLFLGGINTWKSTDGGSSWEINNMWTSYSGYNFDGAPVVHADKHYFIYQDDTTLFEGNDGGIYKTTDGGANWDDLTNGMVISQMYKLGVSQTKPGDVITGLQDNGSKLFYSNDWYDVKGGDGMECIIDYTNNSVQYATYINGQIDRTTNLWNARQDITANMPSGEEENGAWVTPYMLDPNNSEIIYLGYEDVWKSTDRGDSWAQISNLGLSNKIRAMAIAPSNNNVLYITDHNNLYKTIDGGTSWTSLTTSLPATSNALNDITVDATDPQKLWICFAGYDNVKIYESTNGGSSWTNISAGLPSVPANTLVQYKYGETQQLYAGTDMGVYYKDGSADWELFSNGLPSVIVTELEIYYDHTTPDNSTLYASTYGRGLWKSSLSSVNAGPSVSITSGESGTTSNSPIEIDITFSKEVSGFEQADINVSNGSVTSFDDSGNPVFSTEITPAADGEVTVVVPSGVAQDTGGNDNSSAEWSIIYSAPNSIDDLEQLGIKIYPNPFNGSVNFEFAEGYQSLQIDVYDMQGKLVYKDNLNSGSATQIDLNHLQKGVYFITLNVDGEVVQTKLLKK